MKKLTFLLALCLFASVSISAQTAKELRKEREAVAKMSRSELNQKASKDARKQAKTLKKEGWTAAPGALPLEKQLDRAYMMQYQYDEDNYPKYIMGEAMSVGGNYDAAKMQALELAKQNLAGQIQTEVTALIENTVANKQLEQDRAESITETVLASKNLISQSLGRVIPVVECYRDTRARTKEVRVQIAYSVDMAKKAASRAVQKQLEEKGDKLHEELDKALGLGDK